MVASAELAQEQRDDKIAYLAVIPLPAQRSSSPEAVPMATFTVVVASSCCSIAEAMERAVRCNIPIGELRGGDGANVVDGVFQFLVDKGVGHPALRREVAKKAAAHVRATTRCLAAAEEELVDVEFCIVVILGDSSESETDHLFQEEDIGSDLECDEACWQRGASDGDHWQNALDDHHDDDVLGGGDTGGQFAARHYEGVPPTREEGGPSVATLLMRGYEVHLDDPEFDAQNEMTARDMRHLMRLSLQGGDLLSDPAYKRAFDGNTSVTPVPLAEILRQALERSTPRKPSPIPRMRTGF